MVGSLPIIQPHRVLCGLLIALATAGPAFGQGLASSGTQVYGWVQQGFAGNVDSPRDRVNFGTNFGWRSNDYRLNQMYAVLEHTLAHEDTLHLGYRVDALAGQHTVILSTHILPEVSILCDAVIIINKGAIVAQGPIEALVEQFFPTARVEVEIVGPPPAVRDRIRAIPGVLSVQDQAGTNGDGRYVVEAARGRDVRAEIFQLAAQQRWDLLELKRVGMTLEEVFIRIVAGEEAAAGEAGENPRS